MARRKASSSWAGLFHRHVATLARLGLRAGARAVGRVPEPLGASLRARRDAGDWLSGRVLGPAGTLRYQLFRPAGARFGDRLPLLVMLHGCGQDAKSFAASTRMNVVAARERFLVLYPEQDRRSNLQGCWNWFDTSNGRAFAEAALIMSAIGQVAVMYGADRERVAVAGLSAGASMAALLVTRHPERFKAVTMHSGIAPGTAHSGLSAVGAMVGRRSPRPLKASETAMAASWPPLLVIHGAKDSVVASSNGRAAAQVWADASGAHAGDARRPARQAPSDDRHRFQAPGRGDGHAGRGVGPRARLERRCSRSGLQRRSRPRRLAHGVGIRRQAIRGRPYFPSAAAALRMNSATASGRET